MPPPQPGCMRDRGQKAAEACPAAPSNSRGLPASLEGPRLPTLLVLPEAGSTATLAVAGTHSSSLRVAHPPHGLPRPRLSPTQGTPLLLSAEKASPPGSPPRRLRAPLHLEAGMRNRLTCRWGTQELFPYWWRSSQRGHVRAHHRPPLYTSSSFSTLRQVQRGLPPAFPSEKWA